MRVFRVSLLAMVLLLTCATALVSFRLVMEDRGITSALANLATDDGRPLSPGRWRLLTMGYTSCPDVCPATMATLADSLDALDAHGVTDLDALFVTLDPDRDTAAALTDYVSSFHDGIAGLSGSTKQINALARTLGVHHARRDAPGAPDGYFVDHSAVVFLISPAGEVVRPFSHLEPVGQIVAAVLTLTGRPA